MPDKSLRMRRAGGDGLVKRPVMLAIAGDSAAGKTTMTRGLVEALGPDRCVSLCTDDYHRYDREERKELPFTAADGTARFRVPELLCHQMVALETEAAG